MINSKFAMEAIFLTVLLSLSLSAAEVVARITRTEGTVSILRASGDDWLNAKPGMPLEAGDQINTKEESFAEISYTIGTILRMDENTKITLEGSSEKTVKTRSAIGNLWVNMKKSLLKEIEFEVSSPTAIAVIRGTVFRMNCSRDSTSVVSVYDGKVAVGPSEVLKRRTGSANPTPQTEKLVKAHRAEKKPRPFEVSLEQWRDIAAGQEISIRKDGKFKQEKFDRKTASQEKFVKKNIELDKIQ
jgi:hypothetical protein